jgi:hypothetical protein
MSDSTYLTFVVRVVRTDAGRESAVVECVRTGEKQRVDGVAAVGDAIADMLERHTARSDRAHPTFEGGSP